MFIVSPTRGGYRGDVNTAFRTGRKEAFDDYINSHNKALQADNNTYNFNQRVVRDTANNYILQNNMAQDARAEAYDFVDKSDKIADAQLKFDIDNEYRDYLYGKGLVDDLGKAKGKTETNKAFTDVVKTDVDFTNTSTYYGQEKEGGSKVKITDDHGKIALNKIRNRVYELSDKEGFTNSRITSKIKELQDSGDTRDPSEIEASLRSDSAYMQELENERQNSLTQAKEAYDTATSVDPKAKKNNEKLPKFTASAVDFNSDAMAKTRDFINSKLAPYKKSLDKLKEGDVVMGEAGEVYKIIAGKPHVLKFNNDEDRIRYIQSLPPAQRQQANQTQSNVTSLGG